MSYTIVQELDKILDTAISSSLIETLEKELVLYRFTRETTPNKQLLLFEEE